MNKFDLQTHERHLHFEAIVECFLPINSLQITIMTEGVTMNVVLSCGCQQVEHFNQSELHSHLRYFVEICDLHAELQGTNI